jgi:hypothetical protein
MAAGTIILIVFPLTGSILPGCRRWACGSGGDRSPNVYTAFHAKKLKQIAIDPQDILRIGMKSPRAQEFLRYFPNARCYVFGLSQMDGDRAHVILQYGHPYEEIEGAQIDYVMDIGVDLGVGIYIGGKEPVAVLLFCEWRGGGKVGFLPSANIGRALDYVFRSELERASRGPNRPNNAGVSSATGL